MSIEEIREIISKIRTVKYGDYLYSDDHNLQTEAIKKITDILEGISKLKLEAYTRYTHSHEYTNPVGGSEFYGEITEHNEDYVINTDNFAHIEKPLLENDILSIDVYFKTMLWGEPGASGLSYVLSNTHIYLYAYDSSENILCRSEQDFWLPTSFWFTYPPSWHCGVDVRSISINFIVPKNTYKVHYYLFYSVFVDLSGSALWKKATMDIREDIRLLR